MPASIKNGFYESNPSLAIVVEGGKEERERERRGKKDEKGMSSLFPPSNHFE